MASAFVTAASLVLVLVILASVLGAVTRRERFAFVLGIALIVVAHTAVGGAENAGVLLALAGVIVVVASTVPLLRQQA